MEWHFPKRNWLLAAPQNQEIRSHLEFDSAGRVLVTYNRADYQVLDAMWRMKGRTHAGILWCAERSIPRRAIGDLVRAIEAFASQRDSINGICLALPRPPG